MAALRHLFDSQRRDGDNPRIVPFRGVANFRDHGGYLAADGRHVRWRKLFRSGHLAKMTSADQQRFAALEIDTLIDFRSRIEKERDPNNLPDNHDIRIVNLPMLDGGNSELITGVPERVRNNDFEGFDPVALMRETYRQVPVNFKDEHRQFVHTVMDAKGKPVLWHCTAGKDRTGFASAVMLRLLGVDVETVIQDYLLSAEHVKNHRWSLLLLRLMRGKKAVEMVKPLMKVHDEWIRASFLTIDQHWGTFEGYRREVLDLSRENVRQLKDWYLVG
jgi:protein-tyrosine phosphatase